MALNTKLKLSLEATLIKTAVGGISAVDPLVLTKIIEYTNGTGAGKADKLYRDERTLAAGVASETLDISGGVNDSFGNAFTIARVKMLIVINAPSDSAATQNSNDLIIGAAAATQWAALLGTTGTVTLKPGGGCCFWAGVADATAWAAANGATDSLKMANQAGAGGAALTYQLYIVGVSA